MAAMASSSAPTVEIFRGNHFAKGLVKQTWTWTVYVQGECHTITVRQGYSGKDRQVMCGNQKVNDCFGIHHVTFQVVRAAGGSFGNSWDLIVANVIRFKDLPHIDTQYQRAPPPVAAGPVLIEGYQWKMQHFAPGKPGEAHKVQVRCVADNTSTWQKVRGSTMTFADGMRSSLNMTPVTMATDRTSTRGTTSTDTLTHATKSVVEREVPISGSPGQCLGVYTLVLDLRVPSTGEVVPYETPIIGTSSNGNVPPMVSATVLQSSLGMRDVEVAKDYHCY